MASEDIVELDKTDERDRIAECDETDMGRVAGDQLAMAEPGERNS